MAVDRIIPLNEKQLASLSQDTGIDENARPVRFMAIKGSVNICTGYIFYGNIINQIVYWDRPSKFIDMVLKFLQENNPNITITVCYN